ncbi:hypothetical protein ACFQE8_14540 [Salinirubellus sp. GCM10025818]|uniref:DUF7344 domain-containing protein n=1 Tax=Salinirubellus TaxID=2162630 RepID=UPI0030D206C3
MSSGTDTDMSGAVGPDATETVADRAEDHRAAQEGEEEEAAVPGSISNDELFDVLSNRRRRYTLHYLKQNGDEPVEMGDLSTKVAAWELGIEPEALAYDERKRVHTSLYQYHAPKLDDAGIVNYDSQRGTIELTRAGADLDLYLEAVAGREIPWSTYLLLLSVFGASLMGAVWLDVPPLTAIPDATWGLFVAVAFLASSAVFVYDNRYSMRLGGEGPPPEAGEDDD